MALGFETAGGVDRNAPAQGELATFGGRAAFAGGDEAEVLHLDDFAHGRGVVHFGHVHVAGAEAGLFIGHFGGQAPDVELGLIEATVAETADHAGRDLDATALVGTDALEAFLGAENGGGSAVGQRGAHRQGDRVRDGRRRQDLFDAERPTELRVRVVHRVGMVLRRHRGNLPLRGAIGTHVVPAHRSVDSHELAVGFVRLAAFGHFDPFAHLHQGLVVLFGAGNIPAGLENREGLELVGDVHLLGTDRQRHVGGAGLEALHGQVEGGTARGAGVFDVVDGNAFDADLAQYHLAGDGDLALQRAIGHAGIKGDAQVFGAAPGILQCAIERFARQVIEAAFEVSAEDGHGDAGDIDGAHENSL
ncbi:hypothetical protein D9M71_41510 [compost metagenome]